MPFSSTVMLDEFVLYDGREGSERVRVWLQPYSDGIALMSHDIGPGVERNFGKEDIETFLVVGGAHLPALIRALQASLPVNEADKGCVASGTRYAPVGSAVRRQLCSDQRCPSLANGARDPAYVHCYLTE